MSNQFERDRREQRIFRRRCALAAMQALMHDEKAMLTAYKVDSKSPERVIAAQAFAFANAMVEYDKVQPQRAVSPDPEASSGCGHDHK